MKQCHFLPVNARIEFKICVIVYKCLNNQAPAYLQQLLLPKLSLESLRVHDDKLLLYKPKLDNRNYKNRRFSTIAPDLWNKLPLELRNCASLTTFISKLKTHLFSMYFNVTS